VKREIKFFSLYRVLPILIGFFMVFTAQLPAAANDELGFPESHKHFLGTSSSRVIIGFNPSSQGVRLRPAEPIFPNLWQNGIAIDFFGLTVYIVYNSVDQ